MASDLISKKAVNELLDELCVVDYIFDKINELPTVDAVEVVHGGWEIDGVYNRCSVCNRPTLMPHLKGLPQFNYCPNCGADMRGKKNASD